MKFKLESLFFASSPKGSGFDLRLQKTKKNVTQEATKERKSTKLDSTEKYASLSQAIDLLLLLYYCARTIN